MAEEKSVTGKLEKLNVPKTKLQTKLEELEETFEQQKSAIQQYQEAIKKLEREANSVVGAIAVIRELLNDTEEDNA